MGRRCCTRSPFPRCGCGAQAAAAAAAAAATVDGTPVDGAPVPETGILIRWEDHKVAVRGCPAMPSMISFCKRVLAEVDKAVEGGRPAMRPAADRWP